MCLLKWRINFFQNCIFDWVSAWAHYRCPFLNLGQEQSWWEWALVCLPGSRCTLSFTPGSGELCCRFIKLWRGFLCVKLVLRTVHFLSDCFGFVLKGDFVKDSFFSFSGIFLFLLWGNSSTPKTIEACFGVFESGCYLYQSCLTFPGIKNIVLYE